jgi:outer membrane protein OmpA-like peptidoglycan-associated protein
MSIKKKNKAPVRMASPDTFVLANMIKELQAARGKVPDRMVKKCCGGDPGKEVNMRLYGIITACVPMLLAVACTPAQPNAPSPQAQAAPPPAATPSSKPAYQPSVERLVIDFPEGSSALSADANAKLDQAGRLYRQASPVLMTVAGHADKTGGDYANLLLSARRADSVKEGLVGRGIPNDRLQLQAFGASEPYVGSDPSSPDNRAAVITWR